MNTNQKTGAGIIAALVALLALFGWQFTQTPQIAPIPSPTPVVTASPVPTPSPTPVPTSTPSPAPQVVMYHGCQIGQPNDIWNHDVTNDAVDPQSAIMLANTAGVYNDGLYAAAGLFAINGASNSSPIAQTQVSGSSHVIPATFPFTPGSSWIQGSPPNHVGGGGDSHLFVLNTQTCMAYEGYAVKYVAPKLLMYSGNSYKTSTTNAGRGIDLVAAGHNSETTAGGLAEIPGGIKAEEIMSGAVYHAMLLRLHVGQVSNTKYVYPGGPQLSGKSLASGEPVAYGSHLRLKPGYADVAATPECKVVLAALKHYGAYVNDINGAGQGYALEFLNGFNNPGGWGAYSFGCLTSLRLSNFDVLTPTTRP